MALSCLPRATGTGSHEEIAEIETLQPRIGVDRRESGHRLSGSGRGAAGRNLRREYPYAVEEPVTLRAVPGNAHGPGGIVESDGGIELMGIGYVDRNRIGPGLAIVGG